MCKVTETKTNTKTLIWFYARVLRAVGLQKPNNTYGKKTLNLFLIGLTVT